MFVAARVFGIEVVSAFGHRCSATQLEAHGAVCVSHNGLRAPGFATSQIVARTYIIYIVCLIGLECGEITLRQIAFLVDFAKVLPLVDGFQIGTCALGGVEGCI